MTTPSASAPRGYPAVLPLALLEAVRALDAHEPDELDEVHQELAVKRLGQSSTVAAQIERLQRQARRDTPVVGDDIEALVRLVARRSDAGLVFTDAGRRLGRSLIARLAFPSGLARLAGRAMTRRAVRTIGVQVRAGETGPEATVTDGLLTRATPDGAACAMLGAAVAEVLRRLTDFDGAMMHVACQARGDAACVWQAAVAKEDG